MLCGQGLEKPIRVITIIMGFEVDFTVMPLVEGMERYAGSTLI
jgi:hypothetical protein